jgi:hypothetical protein
MLKCNFKSISIPKHGNTITENEDSFLTPKYADYTLLKFAISDGATESSFSKEWSQLLVKSYENSSFEKNQFIDSLRKVAESWELITSEKALEWYAEQKLQLGAFATFLGITINREENYYNAVGIGDCTLFHFRNNELHHSFPIIAKEQFGNTPDLLSTNSNFQSDIDNKLKYDQHEIEANDIILLATDALAAWIFKEIEAKEKPWMQLSSFLNDENNKIDFENWLNEKRENDEIKNDDVTILIINLIQ